MRSRIHRLLVLLAFGLAWLPAQDDPKFSLEASFSKASVAAGEAVDLVLTATVAAGWHAYGTMEANNLPVSLDTSKLQLTGFELAGKVDLPPGDPTPTPIGDSFPLPEVFSVTVPLKVAADATGEISVAGELGYQICEQGVCERPNEAAFSASLKFRDGSFHGAVAQQAEQQQAGKQQPKPTQPPTEEVKPPLMLEPDGFGLGGFGDEKVTIEAHLEPATARAGEVAVLVLDVSVIDGWHAYGAKETINVPIGFDHGKQDVGALEFEGEPVIPAGEEKETPIGPSYPLPHEFQVRQALRVPAGTEPGEIAIAGVLDYQICDETGCEAPTEGGFDAKLVVEAGEARAANTEAPQVSADSEGDGGIPFGSWWAFVLACIGGGLFALAMPCTYPMIPITFSFFTKQAEKLGGNVLPLTILYGLGIITMFVTVGVALSSVIIDVVNHWVTNTIIGLGFFFFAFVLFGWLNLNPPQWMTNLAVKAQSSARGGDDTKGGLGFGSLAGVFFMGATLVLTSFTCTAPIVGTLIGGITRYGPMTVGLGMGIFGLTMAIPFMVLSLMPTKVKAMPRSGEWMDTLKISLGFVELAAAFKFVSMVDIAFGWDILPRELFLMILATVFLMWAMFLFGILRKEGTPSMGASNGRMAAGMAVMLFAAYFLFGAMGNRLDSIMSGFVPAYSNRIVAHGAGGGASAIAHTIVKDDPDQAIEVAKQEDKLLLYNFTGFN